MLSKIDWEMAGRAPFLPYLLNTFWIIGIGLILLKKVSPKFDDFTAYGKLRAPERLGEGLLTRKACFQVFYAMGAFVAFMCTLMHIKGLQPAHLMIFQPGLSLVNNYYPGFLKISDHVENFGPPVHLYLLLLHLVRRLIECTIVVRWSLAETVPFFSFFSGVGYYIVVPLSCAYIDVTDGKHSHHAIHKWPGPVLVMLIFAFVYFNYMQFVFHAHLASLRPDRMERGLQQRHYRLPLSGAFGGSACPHYFYEICIYGILWLLRPNLTCGLMFAFVFLNLFFNARRQHAWYRQQFDSQYRTQWSMVPLTPGAIFSVLTNR